MNVLNISTDVIDTNNYGKTSVDVDSNNVDIIVPDRAPVELNTNTYTISSSCINTSPSGLPTWLSEAIAQELANGNGSLVGLIDDISILVNNLQVGVNQEIVRIDSEVGKTHAVVNTIVTKSDANYSAIV